MIAPSPDRLAARFDRLGRDPTVESTTGDQPPATPCRTRAADHLVEFTPPDVESSR